MTFSCRPGALALAGPAIIRLIADIWLLFSINDHDHFMFINQASSFPAFSGPTGREVASDATRGDSQEALM